MSPQPTCPRCGVPRKPPQTSGLCPRCLLEGVRSEASRGEAVARGAAAPPAIEELAPSFPGYRILEPIGQGGMGFVYRAEHAKLGRAVALKVLRRDVAEVEGFAERFAREARTLASLRHPGIVTLYDFGKNGPWYFFTMELIEGVDLRRLMDAQELSPAEALSIVDQVCETLQYAHDQGVVHRDIKPENIFVDVRGKVRILDFGLAKILEPAGSGPDLTRTSQVMGTPHYMAPEQWERPRLVDHRADIYSLGVVFYELLTRELPIGRFEPPSRRVQVDVRLDTVVLRALEREPERRYQRASEVKEEVDRIRVGKGSRALRGKSSGELIHKLEEWTFPFLPPPSRKPRHNQRIGDPDRPFRLLLITIGVLYALTALLYLLFGSRIFETYP